MNIIMRNISPGLFALCLAVIGWAGEKEEGTPSFDPMAMLGKMQSQQSAPAIDWNKLAEFLPKEIEGMEAGDLDGGTFSMSSPTNPGEKMSHSNVERRFTQKTKEGRKSIKFSIMDSGFNQMLLAPFTMNMEYDSPDGYMKWTEIDGRKSSLMVEKDDGEVEQVQVLTIVSERLVVMVEGNERTSVEEITDIAASIDYDGLAELASVQVKEEKTEE